MTVNTQELREAAEAFKQACDEGLFETEFGTWQALSHEFDQQVSHTVVIALLDEIDALRGERAVLADILRDALGPLRIDLMDAEADGDCEDGRDLRAIIGRAEAALNPPAPPQGETA